MRISEIPWDQLCQKLSGSGLRLETGPFSNHLQTRLPEVAKMLQFLYADFPVEDTGELADFHIRLDRPRTIRRWLRPQVQFFLDGHPPSHPMSLRLAVPLLEWGMNWCIAKHAHYFLIVHAAVVEKAGRGLLITAPPGAGKSTLCTALVYRGWRLLSDELALIDLNNSALVPLARPIGLKNGSIAVIRDFAPDAALGPVWKDTRKGTVTHVRPPLESVQRMKEAAVPAWAIFLTYKAGAPAELVPVPRSRAFLRIADNAFNYSVLGERGFEALSRLIDMSRCYEFSYGNLDEALERFEQLSTAG